MNINEKLLKYAEKGNLKKVKYCIEHGANVNYEDDRAIILSIKNDHLEVIFYLLDNGANIHNYSAIYYITNNCNQTFITYLMKNNLLIFYEYSQLLKIGVIYHDIEFIKYLFQEYVTYYANSIDFNFYLNRALYDSIEYNRLDAVEYFITIGASYRFKGVNCLQYAASFGHLEIVKFFVEKKGDIHIDNDKALLNCAENNHSHVVKYLLTMYSEEEIMTVIKNDKENKILHFLAKNDLSEFQILIQKFRESGIDVYQLIEDEMQ